MEEWRQVPVYEGLYIVSSSGRIQSSYRPGKDKKQFPNSTGYYRILLSREGKCIAKTVHRLMARAFFGDRPELEVNHKNGNKLDNRLENLEYVTRLQNARHAKETNLYRRGEKSATAKLTNALVMEIFHTEGSNRALAKQFGICKSQVQRIKAKETWCHVF